jgi:hypothetical protein
LPSAGQVVWERLDLGRGLLGELPCEGFGRTRVWTEQAHSGLWIVLVVGGTA